MNKIKQRVRASLMAKIEKVDFGKMSPDDYGRWIDALPPAEFGELLDLHTEFLVNAKATAAPPEKPADDNPWTPFDGPDMPVAADAVVYVLCHDDEVLGPNRADAFIWDDREIIGYALASAEPTP
jgi:hypothetical protein